MKSHGSLTHRYLASNLRKLRHLHGMTIKQVAECVGVKPSTMGHYEQHSRTFTFPAGETIDRLASLYGVKIADLFTPEGATEKKAAMQGATLDDAIYIVNRRLFAEAGFVLTRAKAGVALEAPPIG